MRLAALAIAAASLSACASLINSPSQFVRLNSDPPGADCTVTDGETVHDFTAPAELRLGRGGNFTVTCAAPGREPAVLAIGGRVSAWVWGNALGLNVFGLATDFTTGAAFNLVPSSATVSLRASP